VSTSLDVDRPVMPPWLRLPSGIIAGLAAVVVMVLALIHLDDANPGSFDGPLQEALWNVQPPLRYVAEVFDFCGEPVGITLVVTALAVACLLLRRLRLAVLAVAAVALVGAISSVLKHVVGRTIHGEFLSFPSGHTASLTTVALVLALLIAELRRAGRLETVLLTGIGAVVAGFAAGWSQVALGAHYPTDTLGGFCTALVIVPVTAGLVDQGFNRWAARR
jgi:membrane-associated phospholipid phosphatase